MGKSASGLVAVSSFFACSRVIHSGIRRLKLRLVSNRARPAHSRKRAPKNPEPSRDAAQQRLEVGGRHQAQKQGRIDVRLDLYGNGVVVGLDIRFGREPSSPSRFQSQRNGPIDACPPQRMQDDLLLAVGSGVATWTGQDVLDE